MVEIKPQKGFQELFLSSPADVIFGGGAAGAGKTYALLLEPLRYITSVDGFGGVVFRRTSPQIRNEGGLWDTSENLYPVLNAYPRESTLQWVFENGNSIKFSHLQHEKNKNDWQGTQIPYLAFDELTHFSQNQFFYLLSRNRSTCGVRPYCRATCNPDPDSWVAEFIEWYIDPNTGYIIKERDGVLRYFTRDGDNIVWGDSREEVYNKTKHVLDPVLEANKGTRIEDLIKSFTFIEGDIYDNKELLSKDPAYLANLMAQTSEEKARLLDKNWKVSYDQMSLADHNSIEDIFTNPKKDYDKTYCVIDHARFGKDLCTIFTWQGWHIDRIDILSKSDTNQIVNIINDLKVTYGFGSSLTLIDQDGIGVVDSINCKSYYGGSSTLVDPRNNEKGRYKNLKTQLSYYVCEEVVNNNLISINMDNVYVDGVPTDDIILNGKPYKIKTLIKKELRSIKRKNPDGDGLKQIESKEEQKNRLNGMSPNFADNFVMRTWFEFGTPFYVF